MTDYADIIARLEKATGPDRGLDARILATLEFDHFDIGYWNKRSGVYRSKLVPSYTASIDAALTLKPDNWEFVLWTENGMVEAYPTKGVKRPAGIKFRVQGHAPVIALLIAIFKARASSPPSEGEGR